MPSVARPVTRSHLLRRFDRVVEPLEHVGGAAAPRRAQGKESRARATAAARTARRALRLVDDEHVVGADAARHVDFLVALQQALIERAVGVDLALQDVVLDAALLQIEHLGLQRLDLLLHLRFLVRANSRRRP